MKYNVKRFVDNDHGFVHTLEAIIGTIIIIGVIIFITGGFPYTAQKTGEYSKIQLVDIGRDTLDLIELTPITDIFSNYSKAAGVNRTYTLVVDKEIVFPGENVNFTVYYLDTQILVGETLNLYKSRLGEPFDYKNPWTTITGNKTMSFSSTGEYSIIAINPSDETKYSNAITITVGNYFLDTDINGVFADGDRNVDGIVYYPNWSGAPNLTIQILKSDGKTQVVSFIYDRTNYKRIIEDFENINNWTYFGNSLSLNNTKFTQGNNSISINGLSSFWIKKTNSSYKLFRYDNLSFDFYSNNANEKIVIELSKNNTPNKFVWNNISIQNTEWNKIKFQLKNPDIIVGNITTLDVDTIEIKVSNILDDKDYFFDNLTASAGSFNVIWPDINTGVYFIRAIDGNGFYSNGHMIIFAGDNPPEGSLCCDSVIYETYSVDMILFTNNTNSFNIDQFYINKVRYNQQYDKTKITLSDPIIIKNSRVTVTLTAYTAGDYYIYYKGGGGASEKTNSILIRVLPFQSNCLFGDCKPKCSGLDMDSLNTYMRLFIPYYINYNMYLINPDGTLCKDCPDFKEMINGYPTDEAVTVNKIFHIRTINGEYLRELRIILWYK